jgi:hypothetical protein
LRSFPELTNTTTTLYSAPGTLCCTLEPLLNTRGPSARTFPQVSVNGKFRIRHSAPSSGCLRASSARSVPRRTPSWQLTTANAKQRLEFLDAKRIAIDAKLVANVQDLKQHAGSPMCLLTSRLTARLAVLLGTETVATIEVETRSTRMRGRSAPPPSATAPPASSTWTCTSSRMLARHKQLQ